MKTLFLLVIVGGIGYFGYDHYQRNYVNTEPVFVQAQQQKDSPRAGYEDGLEKPKPFQKPTKPQEKKLTCYLCTGEGALAVRVGKHQERRETCMLCSGQGYRIVNLRHNANICPNCDGMGKRLPKPDCVGEFYTPDGIRKNRKRLELSKTRPKTCQRCMGTGVVRKRL